MKNNFKQGKQDLNCRLCGGHLEDQQSLLTCPVLDNAQDDSQLEYRDLFSDRIDKLTMITKLLKSKYEDFTNHVSRQQSSSATGVNVNVDNDNIVNVDKPVEME